MPVSVNKNYICDRCGKEVEDHHFPEGWSYIVKKYGYKELNKRPSDERITLCSGCNSGFEKFVNG